MELIETIDKKIKIKITYSQQVLIIQSGRLFIVDTTIFEGLSYSGLLEATV